MPAAKKPENEAARLASLHALNVLDTHDEEEFNALVKAASLICDMPLSFISLVDADRQWFKAGVGLPGVTETPREVAFCAHAIHQDGIFEVNDATLDARFSDNPIVLNEPHIRFYAGMTLKLSDGANVGTLCVIDQKPNQLTEMQRLALQQLGIVASNLLEGRRIRENEQKLLAEQTMITNMIDQSHDAIIGLSVDCHVTHWSRGAEALFEYSSDEMIGSTLNKLLPSNKKVPLITPTLLDELDAEQQLTTTRVTKNGKEINVSISLSPYFDAEGQLIGATKIVSDISARVEREAALTEQRQLTHAMIESQSVATFMIDADHKVVEWNKACEVLTGVNSTEMIGKADAWRGFYDTPRPCLADLVLDDSKSEVRVHYAKQGKSTLTKDGWHAEGWFDHLGGKRRYVIFDATLIKNAKGERIGALETLQDITQHKLVEQAFEDKQQSLNAVIEGTQAGIWHWNDTTGEYHFSEMWADILGYSGYERIPLTTEDFLQLVNADDQEQMMENLRAYKAGETALYEAEFRMAHSEGHWVWVSARGRLMLAADNIQTKWLHGTYTDITPRKLLELDLKQAYTNLDEFTAVASHDLKSPLRGIADLVEWIAEDLGDDVQDSVKNNLSRVDLRVKRLEALINDLLQYSRSSESSAEVGLVEPETLVNETIDLLSIPKTFNVKVNCDAESFNSYVTPLKTIVRNFISNAVSHHDRDDGNVTINISKKKEFVVFEINDDGPGIPASAHERVFKLFQSLSKKPGASGMGLAISKRLADVHGGSIELVSDIGEGTLIRLLWPEKRVRIT